MMKLSFVSKRIALITIVGFISPLLSEAAPPCTSSASALCTITDERIEFKEFTGMPCSKFAKEVKIDRYFNYTSFKNSNGYPRVLVDYELKMCNTMKEEGKKIKLYPLSNEVTIDGNKVEGFPVAGKIKETKCRTRKIPTWLDTEIRYHHARVEISGFLEKKGKLFDGISEPLSKCASSDEYMTRISYAQDCKLEAFTGCFLDNGSGEKTDYACGTALYKTSEDDCRDVKVIYEWKLCNYGQQMDGTIALRKGASRMLLNGRKLKDDAVQGKLKPGKCQIVHRPSKINTCDNARESLALRLVGKAEECKDYSFLEVITANAFPSASPSAAPTISSRPSASPTLSHQPTLSISPTAHPSKTPSATPTMVPTSKPSERPTKSVAPTRKPSSLPSVSPTSHPSALPTAMPSISSAPSRKPSDSPTVSVMPSCRPSASPTLSVKPSVGPTNIPSKQPSGKPSNMPSISDIPSSKPSRLPSSVPSVPPVTRQRNRKLKSGKSYKSNKSYSSASSKSKSGKAPKNKCQDFY